MIRLLIICFIFLLLYLGFSALGQLDSQLTVNFYDYYLETSFFTFISLYLLLTIATLIGIKLIILIIDLPWILKNLLVSKRAISANYQLMRAMVESIIGDKSQSIITIKKIAGRINKENEIFYKLLLAESEEQIDLKIKYFQELEQQKYQTAFVTKRLAQLFYRNNMYDKSEDYAVKSFNLNESDSETLEILIDCYAKLSLWSKLAFIVSKLTMVNKDKLQSSKYKISNYYLLAAQNMLEINDHKNAIHYLELAMNLVPSHYQALNLYCTLNSSGNSFGKNNKNMEILKTAFIDQPSFEIVEIYKKFTMMADIKIYEDLAILVNPQEHLGLFLAISAYLDLPEKMKILRDDPELLSS
jgi:tetratricopeptide (TPR) repeat protein